LRQEQNEITDFRNNFANRERRISEDREKLNALEVMINSQIDKLERDKKDADSAKKTLTSLRADYVRDLKG
jgi:DNA repair exonuclease SbcCD ATPase subunit